MIMVQSFLLLNVSSNAHHGLFTDYPKVKSCNKFLIKYVNGFHNEYYDVNLLADDTYFELIYEEENYEKLGIYNITYRFN